MSLTAHKKLETISHLGKKVLCSIQSWRKVFKSGEELGQSIICKRFFDGTGLALIQPKYMGEGVMNAPPSCYNGSYGPELYID